MVEISVRDNELFSFTRQKKIDHATNITGEIAAYAYQIFKENYNWSKPIRSVGVRGADLVTDNYWEQIDLFSSVEKQQNVYESIMQYQRVNGYAPTIREICKMVGVASTSSVYAHLKILEEKGYIASDMLPSYRTMKYKSPIWGYFHVQKKQN